MAEQASLTTQADPRQATGPGVVGPGDRLFVVSGCSGSGKSTLIDALARHGEAVVAEPGRQIVKDQIACGGDGLPWANVQAFIDLCAERTIRDFDRQARLPQRCFFDRSFIDVATALEHPGLISPPALAEALQSRRYATLVFMSAPWEALFENDAERRHSFADAVAEYERLVPSYRRHGYELVFLPQRPVAERVAFVLDTLSERITSAGSEGTAGR